MERAFEDLKLALVIPPILVFPNFQKPFFADTDASAVTLGAVLSQRKEDEKIHPIKYASRTTTSVEKRYSASDRETLAVNFALRQSRLYLILAEPFKLMTDQ